MKIFCTPVYKRYQGIIDSCKESFETYLWNPKKPIFDAIEEQKPDIIFCDFKYVNKTFLLACKEFPAKIVLFGESVPNAFDVDVVCTLPSLSKLMKKHLENGEHKTLYIKDYANLTYINKKKKTNYECDLCYISTNDIEGYTAKIGLLSSVAKFGKTKIVGNTILPIPQYLGTIDKDDKISFLKSAKIAIDWNTENILDYAAYNIFCISNKTNMLYPTFDTKNLNKQINGFLKQKNIREAMSKKCQTLVLKSDTCYHRLANILKYLDIDNSCCYEKIEEFSCKQV